MKTTGDPRAGTGRSPSRETAPQEKIPARWAWHDRALRQLRDRLVQARAEHQHALAAPPDTAVRDLGERVQEQQDRDLLWAELGAEADQLDAIDRALEKIRDGSYGLCEQTGLPISPARLKAVPWTRYDLPAAVGAEHRDPRVSLMPFA